MTCMRDVTLPAAEGLHNFLCFCFFNIYFYVCLFFNRVLILVRDAKVIEL